METGSRWKDLVGNAGWHLNYLVYSKLLLPRNIGNETSFTDFEELQWLITQKEKSTEQRRGKVLLPYNSSITDSLDLGLFVDDNRCTYIHCLVKVFNLFVCNGYTSSCPIPTRRDISITGKTMDHDITTW